MKTAMEHLPGFERARSGAGLYFEEHGAGDPLLLLHGGLGGVHSWPAQIPALAARYRVIVPEQRGRGRTPDHDGPLSYDGMTQDTAALIEERAPRGVHVVGASDGGVIGLMLAIHRPELVRRLVVIGANFHQDGLLTESGWTSLPADDPAWTRPRERYAAVSPDGAAHWPIIFAKLVALWEREPELSDAELRSIEAPVLVIAGDDDAVALTHTAALYGALRHGQLAVVPGTSHACFVEKPDLVNRLIFDFLAAEGHPETLLPIRRARGGEGSLRAVD
jgi:pimeloyl-ACP methyl ester carboxylesterase